jgi:hypothetical protein
MLRKSYAISIIKSVGTGGNLRVDMHSLQHDSMESLELDPRFTGFMATVAVSPGVARNEKVGAWSLRQSAINMQTEPG